MILSNLYTGSKSLTSQNEGKKKKKFCLHYASVFFFFHLAWNEFKKIQSKKCSPVTGDCLIYLSLSSSLLLTRPFSIYISLSIQHYLSPSVYLSLFHTFSISLSHCLSHSLALSFLCLSHSPLFHCHPHASPLLSVQSSSSQSWLPFIPQIDTRPRKESNLPMQEKFHLYKLSEVIGSCAAFWALSSHGHWSCYCKLMHPICKHAFTLGWYWPYTFNLFVRIRVE